jgi:hypothetical protein
MFLFEGIITLALFFVASHYDAIFFLEHDLSGFTYVPMGSMMENSMKIRCFETQLLITLYYLTSHTTSQWDITTMLYTDKTSRNKDVFCGDEKL